MHNSALKNCNLFFETYVKDKFVNPKVVNIGSKDNHNNQYKYIPSYVTQIGLDFEPGPNVDIVLTDPYHFPVEDSSVDVVVSSSVFEHCEFFWLTILEIYRILKPTGLAYINAPSNGSFHRFPIDCWRFYPDAANSFVNWGKRSGYDPVLLECYIDQQQECPNELWNDFVCIIGKDYRYKHLHSDRILHKYSDTVISILDDSLNLNCSYTEDHIRILDLLYDFNNPDMKNLYSEDDINYAKKLKWKLS